MSSNLVNWLLDGHPAPDPALLHRDQTVTYGELRVRVHSLAADLSRRFAKGDRIGVLADNSPFYVFAYLAAIRAGLCAVPFPPGVDGKLFRAIAQGTAMRAAFVQPKYVRDAALWCEWLPQLDGTSVLKAGEFPDIDPAADLAALHFTSGSTGEPKGVMATHRNIVANTADIAQYQGLGPQDRAMLALPLSYCFGASVLHSHLRAGASVVLAASFMFPGKVLDEMEARRCTSFAGVPSTFQILLRKTDFARRRFPALRFLQQAGGKLPASTLGELAAAQPDARIFVMYGQTEATARLSYLDPSLLEAKAGSIGRGLPSTRLDVLRADGTAVEPGSMETGEIVASGPNISPGYWRSPEETARYFRGGNLHTGDLARVDADGFIYVVGRARDFIKSMGNRISPQEIEDVLADHPDVLHAAVAGVPDELFGEAVAAFVVPRDAGSLSEEGLIAHCNARLANHKVPRRVYLMEKLPMNSFGKVMKSQLRAPESQPQPLSLATQA